VFSSLLVIIFLIAVKKQDPKEAALSSAEQNGDCIDKDAAAEASKAAARELEAAKRSADANDVSGIIRHARSAAKSFRVAAAASEADPVISRHLLDAATEFDLVAKLCDSGELWEAARHIKAGSTLIEEATNALSRTRVPPCGPSRRKAKPTEAPPAPTPIPSSPPPIPPGHSFNAKAYCARCGWEKDYIARTGRACNTPAVTSTPTPEVKATITFANRLIVIKNENRFDWPKVTLWLTSKEGNYKVEYPQIVKAGESIEAEPKEFLELLNNKPFNEAEETIDKISVQVPGHSSMPTVIFQKRN
jgi:hypothetical protein